MKETAPPSREWRSPDLEGDLAALRTIIALHENGANGNHTHLARKLLDHFGDLQGVVRAEVSQLAALVPNAGQLRNLIQATMQFASAAARAGFRNQNMLDATERVVDYCRLRIGDHRREQLLGLYLDANFHLIDDKILQLGTVNHVTVYPREVLRVALVLQAVHFVIVHNHPCGDCSPSRCDIEMTKELATISHKLGVGFADHIILGAFEYFSFRQSGRLAEGKSGLVPVPLQWGADNTFIIGG